MRSLLSVVLESAEYSGEPLGDGKWRYQGKEGVWRTAKNHDRIFIPDDGSEILGNGPTKAGKAAQAARQAGSEAPDGSGSPMPEEEKKRTTKRTKKKKQEMDDADKKIKEEVKAGKDPSKIDDKLIGNFFDAAKAMAQGFMALLMGGVAAEAMKAMSSVTHPLTGAVTKASDFVNVSKGDFFKSFGK